MDRDMSDTVLKLDPFAAAYEAIRQVAHRQRRRVRDFDTYNTTALVHEAYLRLADYDLEDYSEYSRRALCARVMRTFIVDELRRRQADKRGGGQRPLRLLTGGTMPAAMRPERFLALDEALARMERNGDTRTHEAVEVVQLKYFVGHTFEEIADMKGCTFHRVRGLWEYAKRHLQAELDSAGLPDDL